MLGALTILLIYQLVGEVIAQGLGLPVPGPVIGMGLLLITLMVRGSVSAPMRETANGILSHLSILFIPGGVGVMLYLPRLAEEWLPILASLLLSTMLTLLITAWVIRALIKRQASEQAKGES